MSGKVYWARSSEMVITDLHDLLDEKISGEETLEIVASDCARRRESNDIAFLVTCWILFDEHWEPKRHFAALFKATSEPGFVLSYKLELDSVPSYTRVTGETAVADNRHCWLIFTTSRAAQLLAIHPTSLEVEDIESVGDIFPGLDLGDLPGSAVRSHCLKTSIYRWSVLGFDTGYVIATTLSLKTNFIEDRSKLKFSGAVSVLQILQHVGREDKISVLISSTLGPAAVWTLSLSADKSHFEWTRRRILENTRGRDAVVCCAAGQHLIAIGTYSGGVLVYRRRDLISEGNRPPLCSTFELSIPVISLLFLRDNLLAVLTTDGLYTVFGRSLAKYIASVQL
ncbi:unnamed protein product [Gongylonema pulchrum]|uniref:Uncharacterized protein n=1 Tax=Gongylonema pulchrum TaxID=637853 RepID=A0A3P7MZS6_9BILA|nr:unnamed protein product [Gongylonema pulchrum]